MDVKVLYSMVVRIGGCEGIVEIRGQARCM